MTVKVSVGVATYNGAQRVDDLLKSLEEVTEEKNVPIYVLDDGGKSENYQRLEEVCKIHGVECGRHEHNEGISATWNDLTRHFDSEYMVLLNDDLLLVKDWLKSLLYFMEQNPKVGTAGLATLIPDKPNEKEYPEGEDKWKPVGHGWERFGELANPTDKPVRYISAPGPDFIFKRVMYKFVGGFDEGYKSFYEEVDFATKLFKWGFPSFVLPYPRVKHFWSRTFQENPELNANQRMEESRAYFFQVHQLSMVDAYYMYNVHLGKLRLKWLSEAGEAEGEEIRFMGMQMDTQMDLAKKRADKQ